MNQHRLEIFGYRSALIGILDRAVAKTGFLAAGRFTFADALLLPILAAVRIFPKGGRAIEGAPNLAGYFKLHSARPASLRRTLGRDWRLHRSQLGGGFFPPARTGDRVSNLEKQIKRVFEQYESAVLAKNVEGFMGLYVQDVKFEDVQADGGQDLTLVSAIVSYASISAEGRELRSMQNRLTWALTRREGAWKIVHEHTSAPVGFDDLKAVLRRETGR
jgi:ketosteroid isomerase-like protein